MQLFIILLPLFCIASGSIVPKPDAHPVHYENLAIHFGAILHNHTAGGSGKLSNLILDEIIKTAIKRIKHSWDGTLQNHTVPIPIAGVSFEANNGKLSDVQTLVQRGHAAVSELNETASRVRFHVGFKTLKFFYADAALTSILGTAYYNVTADVGSNWVRFDVSFNRVNGSCKHDVAVMAHLQDVQITVKPSRLLPVEVLAGDVLKHVLSKDTDRRLRVEEDLTWGLKRVLEYPPLSSAVCNVVLG